MEDEVLWVVGTVGDEELVEEVEDAVVVGPEEDEDAVVVGPDEDEDFGVVGVTGEVVVMGAGPESKKL